MAEGPGGEEPLMAQWMGSRGREKGGEREINLSGHATCFHEAPEITFRYKLITVLVH